MSKQYYIVNNNEIQTNCDIFYTLLILLCLLASITFICNYFLNSNIKIAPILILVMVVILCKNIL